MPTILVTGATDGIGRETALALARRGAKLILHGRSTDKLSATRDAVEDCVHGSVLGTIAADLADMSSVRRAAGIIHQQWPSIDVLLHNAGVFQTTRVLTNDGFETTFAVNHLSHLLLTHLLLSALPADGRIIFVSSMAHASAKFDVANLQGEKSYDGYSAYALSKLANVLSARELGIRLPQFATSSLHPGVVTTKLLTTGFGMAGPDSLSEGSKTSVFLALAEEAAGARGDYYVRQRRAKTHPIADDRATTKAFYELSCKMVGVDPIAEP